MRRKRNLYDVARPDGRQGSLDVCQQCFDHGHLIARQDYHRQIELREILLVTEILIRGD
jgi:hypothetical protein